MPGVAEVNNFGGLTTQFQLELDPAALQRFNLSLNVVRHAITANNPSTRAAASSTRGEQGYVVRGVGLLHDLTTLATSW